MNLGGYQLLKESAVEDLNIYYEEHNMPLVSEEDYWAVQDLTRRRIAPNKPHRAVFYPLKAMIICNYCNRNMYVAPSTGGSNKHYLNARCDTEGCVRSKKSLRMKVVFEFIYKFLEKGLNFTEKDYEEYYGGIVSQSEVQRERTSIELHRKQGLLSATERDIQERSLGLIKGNFSETVIKINEKKIAELEAGQEELTQEIKKLQRLLANPEADALSIEEFLNLSKNAARVVKAADGIVKDTICRKIFLNFNVDEEKVLSHQLKEPFDTLLKTRDSVSGRAEARDYELLTTAILSYWKPPEIDWTKIKAN